jgi:hypothetical protein
VGCSSAVPAPAGRPASIGIDCDALKAEAGKRVKAGQEPEPAAKKKKAVS